MQRSHLELKQVSVRAGAKTILANFNLELQGGELVALLGPNGAGKSSLIKSILGLLEIVSGEISIEGRSIRHYSRRELAQSVSYVPQNFELALPYTVFEFASLARYAHLGRFAKLKAADRSLVESGLAQCGVLNFKDRIFSTLSGGEQQLVILASAIIQEPRFLLLDEPTTYLDPKFQELIQRVLRDLARTHEIAVLFATHEINQALLYADRIVALKDGRNFGISESRLDVKELSALYEKEFIFAAHPHSNARVVLPTLI